MRLPWAVLLLSVLASSPLHAGYILTYHLDQYDHDGVKSADCVERDLIQSPNLRQETTCRAPNDTASKTTVRIYRGDRNLVWEFDPATHHYTEMTQADVTRKRSTMEQAMDSAGGHSYKPTGETRQIKKWSCAVYQHDFHDSLADEYCIAQGTVPFRGAGAVEALRRHLVESFDPFMMNPDEQEQLADLAMGASRFTLTHKSVLLDQPVFVLQFTEGHEAPLCDGQFNLPGRSVHEISPP